MINTEVTTDKLQDLDFGNDTSLDSETKNFQLTLLIILANIENHLYYCNFRDNIINKNRSFLNDTSWTFFERIKANADSATTIIEPHNTFYRARAMDRIHLREKLIKELVPMFDKSLISAQDLDYLSDDLFYTLYNITHQFLDKKENSIPSVNDDNFQGYDAKDSGAAPPHLCNAGRINPEHISYLYTAQTKDTAISEIKPFIGQVISVAKLQNEKELKMFDLSKKFLPDPLDFIGSMNQQTNILEVLSNHFKKPNHGNCSDYLPTQAISEFVKEVLNYDGIIFKSSLDNNGLNYVFFDTTVCKVLSSELVTIRDINYNY